MSFSCTIWEGLAAVLDRTRNRIASGEASDLGIAWWAPWRVRPGPPAPITAEELLEVAPHLREAGGLVSLAEGFAGSRGQVKAKIER